MPRLRSGRITTLAKTADVKVSAEIERRQDVGGEIVKGRDRGDQARAPAIRFNPSTRTAVAAISVGAPVRLDCLRACLAGLNRTKHVGGGIHGAATANTCNDEVFRYASENRDYAWRVADQRHERYVGRVRWGPNLCVRGCPSD
jgi:hypothetical protein